jgi:hypothetical protein
MTDNKAVNRDDLSEVAELNDANRNFLEWLTRRKRNAAVTTVDQGMVWAKGTRTEVIDLFKRLADLQLGTFVNGRRGAQSRFKWAVRLTDVGKAYAGEIDEIESVDEEDLEEEIYSLGDDETIEHEYTLRPDVKVTLSLPGDLTRREAKRLADFINTLPFDEE